MNDDTNHRALLEAILSAPGTAHINRTFARTFSLNIFRRNAQELLAATHNVRDSDFGLQLMAVNNREAAQQAHREINRFVHNFAAGAMTLVEHTRNFMRENYDGTDVKLEYDRRVEANFASEPIVQFVQNLRNYFVHKGLPNSEMFIEFQSGGPGAGGAGTLETGVRYKSSAFLEWDGWNSAARMYIESVGEFLDIHIFADAYLKKIIEFHQWLDETLGEFHENDLKKLGEMQEEYARLSKESVAARSPPAEEKTASEPFASNTPTLGQFEFPADAAALIDEAGREILTKIRRLDLGTPPPNTFPTERSATTIRADELVEMPVFTGPDSQGRPVIAFATTGSETFGLDMDVFAQLRPLTERILGFDWAMRSLSSKFVEQTAIK